MTERTRRLLVVLFVLGSTAAACTGREAAETTTTTAAAATTPSTAATTTVATLAVAPEPDFFLMLMWHQHQPRYPLDADGVATRPWVRLHATKDYYDMAANVAEYPGVSAVFNLTPVLLLQLEELANGTKDIYWVTAEIPAGELTEDEKLFLLERFFDTNRGVISDFPRYQELLELRDEAGGPNAALSVYGEQDYRDLQVLFNLAWTDPDFLADEPLVDLVEKGRDFGEEDKPILFDEHLRIIREVIPLHAALWEQGQIEVTTTPLAHPIMPLIADTSLAREGDPAGVLPADRFQEVLDADQQVIRGLDVAERLLGRRPVGMWPAEGAVAQPIMSLFSKNGVKWVATGEEVLAPSLEVGSFTRDEHDLVEEAQDLYRPWQAVLNRNDPVQMFFRDSLLSDLVGFDYAGMTGAAAAEDVMRRLRDIKERLMELGPPDPDRPYVVSIIVDGENAWENYADDGKDFLNALYARLSNAGFVQTITPSEYLDRFAEPEALDRVFPGSWFQSNFATWIGEDEEAAAWEYLFEVRDDLTRAERSGDYSDAELAAAYEAMLFAEGSDWFWWFGSDQESGDDAYFDWAFRQLLAAVYAGLGDEPPPFVSVPIVPAATATAAVLPSDLFTPTIDFAAGRAEWAAAGRYEGGTETVTDAFFGFDRDNLYLRVDFREELLGNDDVGFEIYIGGPNADAVRGTTLRGTLLGFGAGSMIEWRGAEPLQACIYSALPEIGREDRLTDCTVVEAGFDGDSIELSVPLRDVGAIETGDQVRFLVVPNDVFRDTETFPGDGPATARVPDLSNVEVFLSVADPEGDDHGPGTYTYPTDAVFGAGSYDLSLFEVGTEDDDVVFKFEVAGSIQNPWRSPLDLSVQTFDVYIDTDPGNASGARMLLPGRNAALADGSGWELGITVEGWEPAVYLADSDGAVEETTPGFDVVVFGDTGTVLVRIPRRILGEGDPATWAYAAAVMSHEEFPSAGVRRIRDIEQTAQQWRGGGAPADINHTRIFDVAWPAAGDQEDLLSDYEPTTAGSIDDLTPDDFGVIPLVAAG